MRDLVFDRWKFKNLGETIVSALEKTKREKVGDLFSSCSKDE